MIPLDFSEVNVVFGSRQPEYLPLPVYLADDGRLTCCWKLSWRERVRLLFTGILWQQVLTFRQPLQPQILAIDKPDLESV